MSIATELSRIQTARNKIRTKLQALGLVESTALIDDCANAVEGIVNNGSVQAQVQEGETYTVPKGYHDGTGTVSGVAGGGNYNLQSKTVTPTKQQQSITPDSGYYGLSDVMVNPIPEAYQDVTSVTAGAGDVLTGKIIVTPDGKATPGTMPNNGAVDKTLDVETPTYTVPAGYHSGLGSVKIIPETKSTTPTKSPQTVTPTAGKVLSQVTVEAIPDNFIDTTDADALAGDILVDKTAYVGGVKVEGTMPSNGAVSKVLNGTTPSYTIPAGHHNGEGVVSISPETKSVTPTKSEQIINPTTGKVLTKVTVAKIPDAYQDVTQVDAVAADVLTGKKIVSAAGVVIDGAMPNNGAMNKTIDGLSILSAVIPAGYTSGGTVSLTNDIELALAAI